MDFNKIYLNIQNYQNLFIFYLLKKSCYEHQIKIVDFS